MATTTIRDYSTVHGGGCAVVHVEGCDHLRRSAVEVQAMSEPGVWVNDERFVDPYGYRNPRHAASTYRRRFSVDFPIHYCPCAERAIEDLVARLAALRADDED